MNTQTQKVFVSFTIKNINHVVKVSTEHPKYTKHYWFECCYFKPITQRKRKGLSKNNNIIKRLCVTNIIS